MNCLLLGGAGFIGSALARRLASDGHSVLVVDDFSRGRRDALPPHCGICEMDIEDWDGPEQWDWVFCLAGIVGVQNVERDPFRAWRTNGDAVRAALRTRAHKIFYASTSEAYGIPAEIPTPEIAPLQVPNVTSPRAVYAASKIWGEVAFVHSGHSYVIGRFHNIYGPAMGTDHVIPKFCLQVKNGDVLRVDDPSAVRSFCYIDDAVEAILHLMTNTTDVIVNIGNPAEPITMLDLMKRVAAIAGKDQKNILNGNREGFPRVRIPDISLLTKLTGFAPNVHLDEGLRRTYEWYSR